MFNTKKTIHTHLSIMEETNRADIERTHEQLLAEWTNQFCEIVHQQLVTTYGSLHGFEQRNKEQTDS